MKKIPYIALLIFVALMAYKVGDSMGFKAGYEMGYTYDCQEEIRVLKKAHDDLKKSVDFASQKARNVQEQNRSLQFRNNLLENNPHAIEDSIRLVKEVQRKRDSLYKAGFKHGEYQVDPYTGKVSKSVYGLMKGL